MQSRPGKASSSVEMLRKFVEFPTVSRDSNLDLIHYVRDLLASCAAEIRLTHDDEKCKVNFFATLGPCGDGGVMLSGHTDVVSVEGQAWDSDPFKMAEKDGRLHGRGTADMKGFIVCVLALAPEFVERE